MSRNGILAGGNFITDHIKVVDIFPPQDGLANILDQFTGNGGSAYNVLKNLNRLQALFPLEAVGLVGDDVNGHFIINDCKKHSINCSQLHFFSESPTSYTDVFTVESSGRRTFFHQRGANAHLNESHFNLGISQAKIFHLGYLLLLDKLDEIDTGGRSSASHLFEKAQNLGFLTSSDIVSESPDKFLKIIPSSLPYLDYLFLNEYEAQCVTGIILDDKNIIDALIEAGKSLIGMGVNKWAFIHHPGGCVAVGKNGVVYKQPTVKLPPNQIAGAAGAGDALAAGILYGLHEDFTISECLKIGVCTAAASLKLVTCSGGITDLISIRSMENTYGFKKI